MSVPLLDPRPRTFQTENWLLDPDADWKHVGRITWNELAGMTDSPQVLWLNTNSTRRGQNDRVALDDSTRLDCSLYLLHLPALTLHVFAPGADFGNQKRRVQAIFRYGEVDYELWVTDPVIEVAYLAKPNDSYLLGECFVVVSLGEPYEGFAYKLAATVITPDRARE
jgi:hypothetical protein